MGTRHTHRVVVKKNTSTEICATRIRATRIRATIQRKTQTQRVQKAWSVACTSMRNSSEME